jgi:hypothetical protein
VGHHRQEDVTLAWIANSLELGTLKLSENLRAEIESNPMLEIVGGPEELDFDAFGELSGVLQGSLAGASH